METIENIKSNHLHLGKKIERVRRLRGMTQTELGQLLGITKQAVSKMEQTEKIDDERLYCSDDYESLSSLTMQIIDELSSYAGNNEVQEINNIVIEDVEEKVMEIIKQIGEKDCAIDCLKNESLFGEKIKMRARDMLVVFFELEKQFDICFTEDDIKDYTFVSIEKISACIKKHLNK